MDIYQGLMFADSLALAVGVLCLLMALLYRASPVKSSGHTTLQLVALWALFWLVGNSALIASHPTSMVIKAVGYLAAAMMIAWVFGRRFERHSLESRRGSEQ